MPEVLNFPNVQLDIDFQTAQNTLDEKRIWGDSGPAFFPATEYRFWRGAIEIEGRSEVLRPLIAPASFGSKDLFDKNLREQILHIKDVEGFTHLVMTQPDFELSASEENIGATRTGGIYLFREGDGLEVNATPEERHAKKFNLTELEKASFRGECQARLLGAFSIRLG